MLVRSESEQRISNRCIILQGIGNGLPLAAVVTTPEIAQVLAQRLHFNTYGGNPVCSAAGHAVLEVLEKEKRQAHCATVGDHLLHRLRALQDKHDSKCLQETPSFKLMCGYLVCDFFEIFCSHESNEGCFMFSEFKICLSCHPLDVSPMS